MAGEALSTEQLFPRVFHPARRRFALQSPAMLDGEDRIKLIDWDVHFAGVMTQGGSSCNCGLRPLAAHRVLARALGAQGMSHVPLPVGGTNIIG